MVADVVYWGQKQKRISGFAEERHAYWLGFVPMRNLKRRIQYETEACHDATGNALSEIQEHIEWKTWKKSESSFRTSDSPRDPFDPIKRKHVSDWPHNHNDPRRIKWRYVLQITTDGNWRLFHKRTATPSPRIKISRSMNSTQSNNSCAQCANFSRQPLR